MIDNVSAGEGTAWRGERRIVTALFVDIVGSTPLVESSDPEDARELIDGALRAVIEHVDHLGGTVKDLAGDGVLALFGAPVAHEDDAERAVLCGLRAVRSVPERAPGLTARGGVETGLAVLGLVGAGTRVEYGAVGDVVNTAARLQGQAEPGAVLVGAQTRAMVKRRFSWGRTSEFILTGKAHPVVAAPVIEYLGSAIGGSVTGPVVGRDSEVDTLARHLALLNRGRGGAVAVIGDPGLGKSRLLISARALARDAGVDWLDATCLSYATDVPLLPFRHLALRRLRLSPDARPGDVEAACAKADTPLSLVRVVSALADQNAPGVMNPEGVRRRTFAALRSWLTEVAAVRPVVLVVEDLHWADATSLALVESLVPLLDELALLLMVSTRSESAPVAVADRIVRLSRDGYRIDLEPLASEDAAILLRELVQGVSLPRSLASRLLATTAGNPLFLEEQVRGLIAAGALRRSGGRWRFDSSAHVDIAPTVERALVARLDRLPQRLREVLLSASVLAAPFDRELLDNVVGAKCRAAVEDLIAREILEEVPEEYGGLRFRHAMLQEAAARTLLRAQRRDLHARAAAVLLATHAGQETDVAALLGRHLAAAGDHAAALRWLLAAAKQAAAGYANLEAATLAGEAAELIQRVPPELTDSATVREIHLVRGRAYHQLSRHDDSLEALDAAMAAADLDPIEMAGLRVEIAAVLCDSQRLDETLELLTTAEAELGDLVHTPEGFAYWLRIQLDRCQVYYWKGDARSHLALLDSVRAEVEELGSVDQRIEFDESLRSAIWRRSRWSTWPGALDLDRRIYEHKRVHRDPGVRAWAEFGHGFSLLWLGYLEDAGAHLSLAAAEAERLQDVRLRSRALTYLMVRARLMGDTVAAAAQVDEVEEAAREAEIPGYEAMAVATRAWMAYRRGDLQACDRLGRAALAGDAASTPYPFDWMACLPLVAGALARGELPAPWAGPTESLTTRSSYCRWRSSHRCVPV